MVQLSRQIRKRKEYLFHKTQEAQERLTWERKQALKQALLGGKTLPTELRKDAAEIGKDLQYDEAQAAPSSAIDSEYSKVGLYEPKILVTTSRDPSSKLQTFAKVRIAE